MSLTSEETIRYFVEFFYHDQFPWLSSTLAVNNHEWTEIQSVYMRSCVKTDGNEVYPYACRFVTKEMRDGRVVITKGPLTYINGTVHTVDEAKKDDTPHDVKIREIIDAHNVQHVIVVNGQLYPFSECNQQMNIIHRQKET